MRSSLPSPTAFALGTAIGFVAMLPGLPAGAVTVAGFGDSLTWAPGYLAELDGAYTTINLSQGGERSWEGLLRLQALLPTLAADVVIVMEGTNDVLDPGYVEQQAIQSLTGMVDAILAAGMAPVLMAPPPIRPHDSGNPDVDDLRLLSLAANLAGVATDRGIPFVDLFDVFAQLGPLDPYYQPFDLVHPSALGSQVIATAVEPAIAQAIVPEPSAFLLTGTGLLGLAAWARERGRSRRRYGALREPAAPGGTES